MAQAQVQKWTGLGSLGEPSPTTHSPRLGQLGKRRTRGGPVNTRTLVRLQGPPQAPGWDWTDVYILVLAVECLIGEAIRLPG